MRLFITAILFFCPAASSADNKKINSKAVNEVVELTAVVHSDRNAVKALLGVDPGYDLHVLEIVLRPRGDAAVNISRDNFTLISRKDGQKTQALHPSQIAGSSTLVVSSSAPGSGGGMLGNQRRGPIWGGVPGTGDRPRRVGGDDDGAITATAPGKTEASIQNEEKDKNPVLAALKEKELGQGKVAESKSGLLYFMLEGKHKLKDLELIYKAPGGTLILDFEK
jgi:hypothetical protein